jgi:hypothetical protein
VAGALGSVAGSHLRPWPLTPRRAENFSEGPFNKLCRCFIVSSCRIVDLEPTYRSPEMLGVETKGGSNEELGGTPVK